MSFSEFSVPFLVVTMLAFMNAQSSEIPICKPPALRCSMFKRSVCEWSESGEPMWACRGYFETVNNEPRRLQPKPAAESQHVSEPDIVLGTYEFKRPQGDKKAEPQVVSQEETDIQYVTYTYPVATKRKNAASVEESTPEVKLSTLSLDKGSSVSKADQRSEVAMGTYTLPSGSRTVIPNAKVGSFQNIAVPKIGTGSNLQIGTFTLPLLQKKNVTVTNGNDGHIETLTIELPTTTKSSVSKSLSDSSVQIGTYTLPVAGGRKDELAPAEATTHVQMETFQIPSSKTQPTLQESGPDVQIRTITLPTAGSKSDSGVLDQPAAEVQLETYQAPSGERTATSNVESSNAHSEEKVPSESQLDSDKSIPAPDLPVQLGTVLSVRSGSSQGDTEPLTGKYLTDQSASDSNGSKPQEDESNGMQGTHPTIAAGTGAMVTDTNSDSEVVVQAVINAIGSNETQGEPSTATTATNSDLKYERASAIQGQQQSLLQTIDSNSQVDIEPKIQQVHATGNEIDHANYGDGETTGINDDNLPTYPQQSHDFSLALNSQQNNLPMSGYGGDITNEGSDVGNADPNYITAERSLVGDGDPGALSITGSQTPYSQLPNSPFLSGEQSLGSHNEYSLSGTDVSQTSFSQSSPLSSVLSSYYLNSDSSASSGQQYQNSIPSGVGSIQQNYGSGNQNGLPSGYPYNRYSGYQSLEQGSLPSSSQSAGSGNGIYYWPQTWWDPLLNAGTGGYGTHWLLAHNTPLLNPALNTMGASQQSVVPLTNKGYYESNALNSGSSSSAISNALLRNSPYYYLIPLNLDSRTGGYLSSYQPYCNFCKKLMSIFGGLAICDALEPIILEFFNKMLEVFRARVT